MIGTSLHHVIRAGLADLREFAKDGDECELPALDASLLAPLGAAPPPDAVRDLAHLLARYRSFMPPPSRDESSGSSWPCATRSRR